MTAPTYSSSAEWYCKGPLGSYVRTMKSVGGILNLLEVERPAGDVSRPAVSDLVLCQDILGGSRVSGDLGGGRFSATSQKGGFFLAAPNFANQFVVETSYELRSLVFPVAEWQDALDQAADGRFSFDRPEFYGGTFASPTIRSAFRNLWTMYEKEGALTHLLARAAGCEILAELCRLGGAPISHPKGGLAPWAERRCQELMRARISENIRLDELAAEARLSTFHFARMFKQSLGVSPRAYMTRLRLEKACELLERTDLPITQIALEVGYSSNQVLARVFGKHMRISPSEYRRAARDPMLRSISLSARPALEGLR